MSNYKEGNTPRFPVNYLKAQQIAERLLTDLKGVKRLAVASELGISERTVENVKSMFPLLFWNKDDDDGSSQ